MDTVFILENFEGPVFHKLHKGEAWIVGPPVILQCAKDVKVRSIESLSPVDFEFQLYNIDINFNFCSYIFIMSINKMAKKYLTIISILIIFF